MMAQSFGYARAPRWLALMITARPIALPLLLAATVIASWHIATVHFGIPAVILPPPGAVWNVLQQHTALLLEHAVQTTTECLVGFGLAATIGILLGIMVSFSVLLRETLYPNLVFFQLIPKIALAPLFIVWFGVGGEARLAFAIFIAFFPIFVATASGLSMSQRDLVRLCRGLTATRWQILTLVQLPGALPAIFSGLRVGVTMAIIGVIVGEFIVAQKGLGYIILFGSSRADTALILAAITLLCGIGLAMFALVVLAEKLMLSRFQT